MKSLYVFGAGASKDFGLPLGIEVFEYAYRLCRENTPVGRELASVIEQLEPYLLQIFASLPADKRMYPPLEEILTFLWECKNSETYDYKDYRVISLFSHPQRAMGVFELFVKLFGLTLVAAREIRGDDDIERFNRFVRLLVSDSSREFSFISFNYDLLLDDALAKCVAHSVIEEYTYGVPVSDIGAKYRNASDQPFCRDTGVPLLKPHGSLNLVWCPHHQARYGEGYFYSPSEPIAVLASSVKCPACGSTPKPLLIPPLYSKSQFIGATAIKHPAVNARATPDHYRRWFCDHQIRDVLHDADEIVMVGYSMPPYDYDFRSLLLSNLMQHKDRRSLHIRIITKGEKEATRLKTECERLAGSVVIENSNGLSDYLRYILDAQPDPRD